MFSRNSIIELENVNNCPRRRNELVRSKWVARSCPGIWDGREEESLTKYVESLSCPDNNKLIILQRATYERLMNCDCGYLYYIVNSVEEVP